MYAARSTSGTVLRLDVDHGGPRRIAGGRRAASGDDVPTVWIQALVLEQVSLEGCATLRGRAESSRAPERFHGSA